MTIHTGGCHCGAVRYEVEAEPKEAMECNCSHCGKKGFLLSFVPASLFRLLKGDDVLTEYRFNKKHIAHLFCKHCGVQSFGRGKGQDGAEMIAVNLRCVDDLDTETLDIKKFNGKDS